MVRVGSQVGLSSSVIGGKSVQEVELVPGYPNERS